MEEIKIDVEMKEKIEKGSGSCRNKIYIVRLCCTAPKGVGDVHMRKRALLRRSMYVEFVLQDTAG